MWQVLFFRREGEKNYQDYFCETFSRKTDKERSECDQMRKQDPNAPLLKDDVVDEWNCEVGFVHQMQLDGRKVIVAGHKCKMPDDDDGVIQLLMGFLSKDRQAEKEEVRSLTSDKKYVFLRGRRTHDLRVTVLLSKDKRRILVCRAFMSDHTNRRRKEYECSDEFIKLMDEPDERYTRW